MRQEALFEYRFIQPVGTKMYNDGPKPWARPRSYIYDILDSLGDAEIQPATINELYNELKRHRVLQVIIIYGVVGWGLIVGASALDNILALPDWADRLLLLLVGLGLPLAIVLAWICDSRSHRIEHPEKPELDDLCLKTKASGIDSTSGTIQKPHFDPANRLSR